MDGLHRPASSIDGLRTIDCNYCGELFVNAINTRELLDMSIDPIVRAIKRYLLTRKIKAQYRHLEHFRREQDHAQEGAAYTSRLIVNAESRLKDLK